MRRTRRQIKRASPTPKIRGNEPPTKKVARSLKLKPADDSSVDSSSESDIENYLKPAAEIDLNSSFFTTVTAEKTTFEDIEKDIFSGVNRLSESESEDDSTGRNQSSNNSELLVVDSFSGEQLNKFEHIHVYNEKIEEAKKHIEIYEAKRGYRENNINVLDILAVGESKSTNEKNISVSAPSSDFETFSESEKEDWEEIGNTDVNALIPKEGVQITVELPGNVRKRKGTDLMDAVKRRLNRIKKENQVYVHKVHLLCWVAHGNYVNKILGSNNLMGLLLSLLPSQQCYPPARLNISYLEDILQWYRKNIKITERTIDNEKVKLEDMLEEQITKKEVDSYKMFVYIFVCLLRTLGIRCRLMLSLQVEPLKPPQTELCSLSKTDAASTGNNSTAGCNITTSHRKVKSTPTAHPPKKKSTLSVLSSKKIRSNTKPKNLEAIKQLCFENMCSLESADEKTSKTNTPHKLTSSKQSSKKNKTMRVISDQNKTKKITANADGNIQKFTSKTSSTQDYATKIKSKQSENKIQQKERETNSESKSDGNRRLNFKKINKQGDVLAQSGSKKKQNLNSTSIKATPVLSSELSSGKSNMQFTNSTNVKLANQMDNNETYKNLESDKQIEKVLEIPLRRSNRLTKRCENNTKNIESDAIQENCGSIHPETNNKPKKLSIGTSNILGDSEIKRKIKTNKPKLCISDKTNTLKFKEEKENESNKVTTGGQVDLLIPQLDGGNDETNSDSEQSKSKGKLRINKLKRDNVDKCSLNKRSTKLENRKHYKNIDSNKNSDYTKSSLSLKKSNARTDQLSPKENSSKLKSHPSLNSSINKLDVRNDIVNLVRKNISEEKQLLRSKIVKHKRFSKYSDSDSDYMPKAIKKKVLEDDFKEKSVKVKRRIPMKKELIEIEKNRQAAKAEEKKKKGINIWIEVFAEAEEKWISVDVIKGQVHCIKEIYARATHPISYILGWDNENYIKDLTKRYCLNWNTVTRKLRVDNKWWEASLLPYKPPTNPRDREEDEELARQQLEQPLPTTISEYKNHPLYCLKRHLLKFEGIYPQDALILGFVRNEPVYSRDCVHVLHSREIWLKHAKIVKPGEKPYKIVKARPKYDKLSNSVITDKPLEIFGEWQIEEYVPPTAENGVVPRNAYGNVELFKPTMLPKGTVHLQLPGLNKVARRMNIDCAPAIVGFDFHGGWSHPTYDGYIVCEEFSEQLIAAWYQEQEESEKRAQEKIEKRVYENWRRLIRGLLIREKLKAKYDFGEASTSKSNKVKKKGLSLKKRKVHSDSD